METRGQHIAWPGHHRLLLEQLRPSGDRLSGDDSSACEDKREEEAARIVVSIIVRPRVFSFSLTRASYIRDGPLEQQLVAMSGRRCRRSQSRRRDRPPAHGPVADRACVVILVIIVCTRRRVTRKEERKKAVNRSRASPAGLSQSTLGSINKYTDVRVYKGYVTTIIVSFLLLW